MRYLKWGLLALLAVVLLTVALANREVVELRLLPVEMAAFLGIDLTIRLPMFLAIFGGIVAGLLIGFVWEWFREHKHRAAASRAQRDKAALEREVSRLKSTDPAPQDDVIALLERPRKAG
jgi:lipopolysaccharide assembly protein A